MPRAFTKFFLSAFGLGFLPWAPGTWGSLGGLALVWFVSFHKMADVILFLVLLLVTATLLTSYLKGSDPQDKDPHFVVMDEVLGIFVTFLALPVTPLTALIGFLLFRIFDVVKPFGIRRLEKIDGAWGIILDDLAAGLFAHVLLVFFLLFGVVR